MISREDTTISSLTRRSAIFPFQTRSEGILLHSSTARVRKVCFIFFETVATPRPALEGSVEIPCVAAHTRLSIGSVERGGYTILSGMWSGFFFYWYLLLLGFAFVDLCAALLTLDHCSDRGTRLAFVYGSLKVHTSILYCTQRGLCTVMYNIVKILLKYDGTTKTEYLSSKIVKKSAGAGTSVTE